MEAQINSQEIMEKLNKLQEDVNFIKCNIIDPDCILDKDDTEALKLAEKEYERGELVSLEDIEKLRKENVSN
jgi:uncharacterized protein YoxC